MGTHCSSEVVDSVGLVKLHSGKVNAFSHDMIEELHQIFDDHRDNEQVKAVILTGQEGIFSGGFDLKVMKESHEAAMALVKAGGQLLTKLYLYEKPLIIACSGHAMAMGAIMLFVGDVRLGTQGQFKIGLNETAIGMTLPKLAVALAKDRISPAMLTRAVAIGEIFSPDEAQEAGYLDKVVVPQDLEQTALAYAMQIGNNVQLHAFAANKRRLREVTLESVANIWD
ncbi:crotonase/enoyl-CoA hydratase family protein [Pseudobacteriovorax antillogorgiicola]|uniref:Enoyl-CoA hydratase n=1 Tax=Pseudobacteriovorax antillogorgiicola TaxID=1513793 RepID=A0A1Y6CPX9_9BACT|nr:crotonase/enoyl-CoA hydratase family protein [Pseudobacteriovorax antillogorgiicola]TCS43486.1 enoyl-CoA hydratase [Pseudobacteriovorax antillogorgiicola]SMF81230.1 enoyl-CoA hydratase [Pseudobacteriovorax antillogorgiicola]